MNIHFDRFRTQEKIEQVLGCYNLENWKDYKNELSTFSADEENKDLLLDCLKKDTRDTYFKGIFIANCKNILFYVLFYSVLFSHE